MAGLSPPRLYLLHRLEACGTCLIPFLVYGSIMGLAHTPLAGAAHLLAAGRPTAGVHACPCSHDGLLHGGVVPVLAPWVPGGSDLILSSPRMLGPQALAGRGRLRAARTHGDPVIGRQEAGPPRFPRQSRSGTRNCGTGPKPIRRAPGTSECCSGATWGLPRTAAGGWTAQSLSGAGSGLTSRKAEPCPCCPGLV